MTQRSLVAWLTLLISASAAATMPSSSLAADPPARPATFRVPGYWEPKDGRTTRRLDPSDRDGLVWHEGYLAERRPLWKWRPHAWVGAGDSQETFRPGAWLPADAKLRTQYLADLKALELPSASQDENLMLRLGQGWKVGYEARSPDGASSILEMVRDADDIDHWQELVTIQAFPLPSGPMTPRDIYALWKEARESRCPGKSVERVLAEDSLSILFEWRTTADCTGQPPQHEISRWVLGPWTLYRAAYTIKRPEMPESNRREWEGRLARAIVACGREPEPSDRDARPAPPEEAPVKTSATDTGPAQAFPASGH